MLLIIYIISLNLFFFNCKFYNSGHSCCLTKWEFFPLSLRRKKKKKLLLIKDIFSKLSDANRHSLWSKKCDSVCGRFHNKIHRFKKNYSSFSSDSYSVIQFK